MQQVKLGCMRTYQGGRARGVDGHTCALQVEGVRETIGSDRVCASSSTDARLFWHHSPLVLVNACEHSYLHGFAHELLLVVTTTRQRYVSDLHTLPLGRIHALRLRRRYVEEFVIKELHTIAKASMLCVRQARSCICICTIIHITFPTRFWMSDECIDSCVAEKRPQLSWLPSSEGVTSSHGANCYRIASGHLSTTFLGELLQLSQVGIGMLSNFE
mmetsp:Transcript_23806/g.37285  ORF Transcript_23806/g.37285 Transcript_23806/m.37285 type:complete len:216 (+) Transcript_23806:601-1248(+)